MRILLVNPGIGYYTRAHFNPLGLIAIGSFLTKKCGFEVKLIDRCVQKCNIRKEIDAFRPEFVGVSLMSSRGLKDAVFVSKAAKTRGIPVGWGGGMPSMQPELMLQCEFVDYIMVGEGEYTIRDLLEHVRGERPIEEVDGLVYRKAGKIVRNKPREFADLADFPVTDFSLIDPEKYLRPYFGCEKLMYLYSSKGCPMRCAFCPNPIFNKSRFRKRPNEYVIEEIRYLIANHGLDGVYFSDEMWCMRREDMLDFCRRVKENDLNFHWAVQVRIGQFTKEDFQLMYDCGCRVAFFGIECGSDEIRQKIHKNIDPAKIAPTFDALKEIGITSTASFIIGFPGETAENLRETVKLILSISATLIPINLFSPLPGTELYFEAIRQGKYREPKTLKELSKYVVLETVGQNLSAVPTVDLHVIKSWFEWRSFTKKDAIVGNKPFAFAIGTIKSGLKSITQRGPLFFFVDGFKAFGEFTHVFWYSHAYPGIRKKYGLK
ncbi:MAG: radical SAM protein [Clostridia bacterium]|nr:radical SAM protein [Clostridia bacterium]